ncbi:DUF2510 domain-containing protein [Luteimicrobium album]|uniref:DUF2510 domain-containing protein n=1 Tax=Luteimicrobium album TaxID=1054550 RepID=UPI0024E07637|nr:DUF2510 domain-containing protein [Luteimicrobium album]
MTENPTPQAGWYPDPAGTGQLRWYDGTTWTEQYQVPAVPGSTATPAGPPLVPSTAPRKRSWFARHKVLTGLGAAVALVVVIAVVSNGEARVTRRTPVPRRQAPGRRLPRTTSPLQRSPLRRSPPRRRRRRAWATRSATGSSSSPSPRSRRASRRSATST